MSSRPTSTVARAFVAFFALSLIGWACQKESAPASSSPATAAATSSQASAGAPRADSRPDRFLPGFDPDRDALPPPRRGGSVVLHSDALPQSLNFLIDNSSMCRRLQRDLHETLIARDFWTLEQRPVLCERWRRDDALVLRDGRRVFGALTEGAQSWSVEAPEAAGEAKPAAQTIPKAEVERVVRGAAYTFWLRRDVRWHDGHPFDAADLLFTWRMTRNPFVACDAKRFQYEHITSASSPEPFVVRFEFDRTYYASLTVFEALTPLPRHLYDLADPDNAAREPDASDERQGRFVNEHRCNREWVGLGPYRLTKFSNESIEIQRWEGYFDPANGGWIERVRWRPIADDRAAFQALLAGEIDFTTRVLSDDYFGAATRSEEFTARCYKGYFYTPIASYVAWNLERELFADVRVRRAFAHAFDWDEFIAAFYGGLARRATAEWIDTGPDYDEALAPLKHDPRAAAALLGEAGWIDRDGDGVLDKDGRRFEFAVLIQAGNKPGEALSQRLQESLGALGVRMRVEARDWPSLSQAVERREYDAAMLAWVMPIDSDPRQRWHSSEARPGTANYTSFADAQVDALIERIEVELDRGERTKLMHALQARLYELQPYLYGVSVAKRFAIDKRIRNFRTSVLDPGYSVREWWLAE
jgi:peptide/nickel transport system substrate-binding protein